MLRALILVSNNNKLSSSTINSIINIVDHTISCGKEIHIFKEDIQLYELLKNNSKVTCVSAISNASDSLIFNRINDKVYSSKDIIKIDKTDYSDIFKKAISRNTTPTREASFDNEEYLANRESIVFKRLKFSMQQIISKYSYVAYYVDIKSMNIVQPAKSEVSDGKFYYIYDCTKDSEVFWVGGFIVPINYFYECVKGDM